jgi:GTP-binding protein EngB required for normal cell division
MKEEPSGAKAGGQLRDYDRLKLELASLVRRMFVLIDGQAEPERHRRCQSLLAQLAEDRFTLAVVGQFNRGKSSLMNAILGMDRLPVGVVPLTSVITKVSYGNPERVLIHFMGSSLSSEIRLEELPEYVTETGNPANKKRIAAAEVQLPSEFLRRGLFFVDTPGVGSVIAANTATTEQFLPEADAVIFITSFDSPLGREELEFLSKVREHVRKVFFVVNKLDLVSPAQRDQVLTFTRNLLRQEAGLPDVRLFPVSALLGLKAKLSGSAQELTESGMPALEENLVEFLTTEKTAEFLARVCDRALALLGELEQGTVETAKSKGAWAGAYDQFMAREAHDDPKAIQGERSASISDLFSRLTTLRGILLGQPDVKKRPSLPPRPAPTSIPEAELMDAVRRPCEVCSRLAKAGFEFMAKFQYQIIVNENDRSALASSGGLCPLHTWQYAEIGSPQGISTAYPTVLTSLSERLNLLAASNQPGGLAAGTRSLVTGQGKCRACQKQHAVQDRVIGEILGRLGGRNGQDAIAKLPVLCLPHLSVLLRKLNDPELGQSLIAFEAALFERLAENMERYGLKHDALRRGLQSKDERVAYHRALSQLVGDKRLQSPWHVEYLL